MQALPIVKATLDYENPRYQNLWNFYRKDLVEESQLANPESTTGCFTVMPKIPSTPENIKLIDEIGELADQFSANVNLATRSNCCCFFRYNKMFGSIE
jgi:hypothetical protein